MGDSMTVWENFIFFSLPFLNLHNIIAQPVEYPIFVGKSQVKKWVGFSVKARVVSTIQ